MGWINSKQQERDHSGKRNACAACGNDGSRGNPLEKDDTGYRVHKSHFSDRRSGLYGKQQRK